MALQRLMDGGHDGGQDDPPKEATDASKEDADVATTGAATTEQAEPVETTEDAPAAKAVEVHHRGGGWYDVLVDGEPANESGLRKDDAEAMAAELKTAEDLLS